MYCRSFRNLFTIALALTFPATLLFIQGCGSGTPVDGGATATHSPVASGESDRPADGEAESNPNPKPNQSVQSNRSPARNSAAPGVASLAGQWVLSDLETAKAAWEKFAPQAPQHNINLPDDNFLVQREIKRAAEINKDSVLTIASDGQFTLKVDFVAEGRAAEQEGGVIWNPSQETFVFASNPGPTPPLVEMWQVDDVLVGIGTLPYPLYWCMVRKK